MAARKKTAKKSTRKSTRKQSSGGASSGLDLPKNWQAESDARTLADAEEIRANSRRMARATTEIRKQRDALGKVLKPT